MTTWFAILTEYMKRKRGDSMHNVVAVAPLGINLSAKFEQGHAKLQGKPFTLWTAKYVYFPLDRDGMEQVARVPREPCDIATRHI